MRFLIFAFFMISNAHAGNDALIGGTFSGVEMITKGTCQVHILLSTENSIEVLFTVANKSNEVIHLEVLPLDRRLYGSSFSPDFDRSTFRSRTYMANGEYEFFDYASFSVRPSQALGVDGFTFVRSKTWIWRQYGGPTTYETRPMYECPILVRLQPSSLGAPKPPRS